MQNAFEQSGEESNQEIFRAKEKIKSERDSRKYIPYDSYSFQKIQEEIKATIRRNFKASAGDADLLRFSFPPEHVEGDIAIELFAFAKNAKKSPNDVAKEFVKILTDNPGRYIKGATALGPFVNVSCDKEYAYDAILRSVNNYKEHYGESDIGAGKVVVMDYSSPNIAKPIGVGHLRSTIIGQTLMNIYNACGFTTIGDNHLGDWGTQFGSLIFAYQKWGNQQKIKDDPIKELNSLYVRFHEEAAKDPSLKENSRKIFSLLEHGDEQYAKLWKQFREWSLIDFNKAYKKLGVSFDLSVGERFFLDQVNGIVKDCMNKKICEKDPKTGAIVVPEHQGLPSFLLQKQDGSTLYITRDMATLIFRIKEFDPESILYVVGQEQELNFKQLFFLAKQAGHLPEKTTAKHISFGLVLTEGKKMSTRKGTLIELDDLIQKSIEKSKGILKEKKTTLGNTELEKIAEQIGIGAIVYNDLKQSRIKNISFDWNRMLDFSGGSAVYLQYTYVRIQSIVRKLGSELKNAKEPDHYIFDDDEEFALAKKIMIFPEVIIEAQRANAPHVIATYLENLAQQFNVFYGAVSIIQTKNQELKASRIALVEGVARVLKKGLALLNIQAPQRM